MLQYSLSNSIRSKVTTLIETSRPTFFMYYNRSCRACGTHLTPISLCNICKEYLSWTCGKCLKMDDVTHSHNYYIISYKPEKIAIRKKRTIYSIIYNVI